MRQAATIVSLAVLGVVLLYGIGNLPPMGDPGNPDKTHVSSRYLEHGHDETGAENLVTGVILNYRSYDTEGEVAVIFCALCAVIALLGREKKGRSRSGVDASASRVSPVLVTVARFLAPVILFFAGYTILHGELTPGGGFQGGAVIGASIIVFTLAFGLPESTTRLSLRVRIPMESLAVLLFLAVGFVGMAFGASFLTLLLPGLNPDAALTLRLVFMVLMEIGIGAAGGVIFTSIVFAMIREDEYELEPGI